MNREAVKRVATRAATLLMIAGGLALLVLVAAGMGLGYLLDDSRGRPC